MLPNNIIALIVTLLVSLAWLRICDFAAHRGWISSYVSRKIIHIGTGPIFVLCWLLFKNTPSAPYLAALVPGAITLQFILVGLGVIKDEAAVQAMSRTGDRREILKGPLYYGIVFVVVTILYWLNNPVGIVALMLVCGGDGLAALVGRQYGKAKLPWNKKKSWVGFLGVLLGGWILSAFVLAVFVAAGVFPAPFTAYLLGITLVSFAGALVESLPFEDVDNLTITLAALIIGPLVF
jgi:phytol kinase